MRYDEKMERVLRRFEPGRREAMRKILGGAALYTAPVVASFSLDSLGGAARAQAINQTEATPVPTMSGWGLGALIAAIGTAGALVTRRFRGK